MDEKKTATFEELRDELLAYTQLRVDLAKAAVTEKSSILAASMITGIIVGALLFFAILFVGLACGFWFSQITGSYFKGFGMMAGIYVLMAFIIYSYRKSLIETRIINNIIKLIYKDE